MEGAEVRRICLPLIFSRSILLDTFHPQRARGPRWALIQEVADHLQPFRSITLSGGCK